LKAVVEQEDPLFETNYFIVRSGLQAVHNILTTNWQLATEGRNVVHDIGQDILSVPHQLYTKMLIGNVVAGEVHPQPYIWVFGDRGKIDFHWWDPSILTIAPQVWRSSISLWFSLNSGVMLHCSVQQWSHAPLLHCSREQCVVLFTWTVVIYFFWKTSVVNLFHPHCSREHELLIFFCFLKKLV
jgi:hypothetical protein